jgi:hypothetical protein
LPDRARARSRDAFSFDVAGPADDRDIRTLMRESVFPGSVSLSFEREPDASIAARIEGPHHDYIVARESEGGRIAAIASRSVRDRFVNGQPMRVGYLGQLRVHRDFRRTPTLIDGGFAFCRTLHDRNPCDVYLASVVSENTAARRVLERGRAGWPAFTSVDDIVTFAVPARRNRRSPSSPMIDGAAVGAATISAFLWRHNARYQFSPCWNAEDLSGATLPGLGLGDIFVATRGGSIAGCAALWDQRPFKQIVVRGYSPVLRRARTMLNLAAPLTGSPRLPPSGEQLRFAFLSHLAVEDDDIETGLQLVATATDRAAAAGLDYVALGLSSRSPLAAAVSQQFRHRSYRTTLFATAWPGADVRVDSRPSQPEIAIL